jgi:hypothetical protein
VGALVSPRNGLAVDRASEWRTACFSRQRTYMWIPQLLIRFAECRLEFVSFVSRVCRKGSTRATITLAGLLLVPSVLRPADQTIQVVAVTNSADFQPGLPQKGSLASIFCTGLQGGPGVFTAPSQPPLPTQITVVDPNPWGRLPR